MFGLLSSRPEYSSKISHFIAMAPIARHTNATTIWRHGPKILDAMIGHGIGRGCNSGHVKMIARGQYW